MIERLKNIAIFLLFIIFLLLFATNLITLLVEANTNNSDNYQQTSTSYALSPLLNETYLIIDTTQTTYSIEQGWEKVSNRSITVKITNEEPKVEIIKQDLKNPFLRFITFNFCPTLYIFYLPESAIAHSYIN